MPDDSPDYFRRVLLGSNSWIHAGMISILPPESPFKTPNMLDLHFSQEARNAFWVFFFFGGGFKKKNTLDSFALQYRCNMELTMCHVA